MKVASSGVMSIDTLSVAFPGNGPGMVNAVKDLSFVLEPGKIMGIAGESGSGKSTVALALLGLLPYGTSIGGSIRYQGVELVGMIERDVRRLRGSEIALISQDATGALNPTLKVGRQLKMVIKAHEKMSRDALERRLESALVSVGLMDVERVKNSYPQQLSGGMCQRVMIAMALACRSKVLIADEPTTALDVSVQSEIIRLIKKISDDMAMSTVLISHDLSVLKSVCDNIIVMYKGECVESGSAATVLADPKHPYTRGLIACIAKIDVRGRVMHVLPDPVRPTVSGCGYGDRCELYVEACNAMQLLRDVGGAADTPAHMVRCHRAPR